MGFPLQVSPNGRYLVDSTGRPRFVHGDTAWSLLVGADRAGVEMYLDDRATRGFNAVVVNLIERLFAPDAPRNLLGDAPFATPGRLGELNERYAAHAHAVVQGALERDMLVLLAPAYLGYATPAYPGFGGAAEGWYAEVLATSIPECRTFGEQVGRLFADCPNVLWVMSGDRNPGDVREHVRAIASGIAAEHPSSLFTAHVHPEAKGVEHFAGDTWLTVNQTYSYSIVHRALLEDYDRRPTLPNILFESTYEGEHNASELQIRRQAYWSVTRGACGNVFGSYPLWMLGDGWQGTLGSAGAQSMQCFRALVDDLAWWELVPDRDHDLIVDGRGEHRGLDLATTAHNADCSIWLSYVPTPRTVQLDASRAPGPMVQLRWFDPISRGVDRRRAIRSVDADHRGDPR